VVCHLIGFLLAGAMCWLSYFSSNTGIQCTAVSAEAGHIQHQTPVESVEALVREQPMLQHELHWDQTVAEAVS